MDKIYCALPQRKYLDDATIIVATSARARNDGGGEGCQRKKKTAKRGKSFAKDRKDVAEGLLDSATLCFDGEKTPFF